MQVGNLRSLLVKSACVTIAELVAVLQTAFEPLADSIVAALLALPKVTIEVGGYSEQCEGCISVPTRLGCVFVRVALCVRACAWV